MKCRWCSFLVAGLIATTSAHADQTPWQVPGDVAELKRACKGRRGLETFARNGYLGIECGYQAILLGSQIPIAPAPHVAWAKPYARGPIKLLIVTSFGNAPTDVQQLTQVVRALEVEVRWVLVADVAVTSADNADTLYRTRFLDAQVRAALREDYDAILITFGTNSPGYGTRPAHPYFSDAVYNIILDKLRHGTGLVLVGQNSGGFWIEDTPLSSVLPAHMAGPAVRLYGDKTQLQPAPTSRVFAGLNLVGPWFTPDAPLIVYEWRTQPDTQVLARMAGLPVAMTRTHGQGRVVLLGWDGTLGPKRSAPVRAQLEQNTAVALRAITYAAHKEPAVTLELPSATLTAGEPGAISAIVSRAARLMLSVHDEHFRTLEQRVVRAHEGHNTIRLPAFAKGAYDLHVRALDQQGRVLAWADQRLTVDASWSLAVASDKEVYQVGETAHFSAQAKGIPQAPDLLAHWQVRDATGRVLMRDCKPLSELNRLDYTIQDARIAPHKAVLLITRGSTPLIRTSASFYVPSSTWEDYENILWPLGPLQLNAELQESAGITAVLDGYGRDTVSSIAAHYGLHVARMNDVVLRPALVQTSPRQAASDADAMLQSAGAAARRYGALAWVLQDERGQLSDPGMPDAEGLARYRRYLQAHYPDLSALNRSWTTHYARWNDIQPTLTNNVQAGVSNLAPWVDFRLYVADQAFEADKRHAQMLRAATSPSAHIGLDGFIAGQHMVPYGALDIGRLANEGVFDFYVPYSDDLLIAGLFPGPKAKYVGWAMSRADYFGAPFRDAFRGYWGSLRFFGPTLYSDFGWLQPAGRWTAEGTAELRAGIGKLLMQSERELSPVVILYSYPSLITSSAAAHWAGWQTSASLPGAALGSRAVLERMLLGAGVSFGYQTDAKLAQVGLPQGTKLLIIPWQMGLALSDGAAQAIARFVRSGGTVLADLLPAQCDEHGKRRIQGPLDALFGVHSAQAPIAQGAYEYGAGVLTKHALVPQGEWLLDQWYDKSLHVTRGFATGMHAADGAPAFIVNRSGRGQSLLLNVLLASEQPGYPSAADGQYALMRRVLEAADVKPLARLELKDSEPATCCEVNRFRDHANLYYGIYAHEEPSSEPESLHVRFEADKHTYDVRAGRYLGQVRDVPLSLHAHEALLLARLDYQLTGLTLRAPHALRGEPVHVQIDLGATQTPGRHVVHVQVSDPSGAAKPLYAQNVVLHAGHGELTFLPALSEPAGRWQIRAREVISGLRARCTVELQ